EDGHLLALAFQRSARGEDLRGEGAGGGSAEITGRGSWRRTTHRLAVAIAEAAPGTKRCPAARTHARERRSAVAAELRLLAVVVAAGGAVDRALHGFPLFEAGCPPGGRALSTPRPALAGGLRR